MNTTMKLPFYNKNIAEYLRERIETMKSIYSQRQIAARMGLSSPNMLSMMKRGEAKVPLERVPAIAAALDADPVIVFGLAMEQYWTDPVVIEAVFSAKVTPIEIEIIELWPEMTTIPTQK